MTVLLFAPDLTPKIRAESGIEALSRELEARGANTLLCEFSALHKKADTAYFRAVTAVICGDNETGGLPALAELKLPTYIYGGRIAKLAGAEGAEPRPLPSSAEAAADEILRGARAHLERVTPPFFKALVSYRKSGSDSWHCPGHAGGEAFTKTAVGAAFGEFFGENMLRTDVCNAVEELGQLLEHSGPVKAAEENTARVFGADHAFFVTNGTSTSNKIVWHSQVGPDDIVVVDRNCHKSNLHAIMMTGAIPVFLAPSRNHYGIIGPIPRREFHIESILAKIAANPLISGKKRRPRLLTLTQSTYDGVLYNAETIKSMLDGRIEAFHFDEAWLPHAPFHPLYQDMHAIARGGPPTKASMVYATQSTHKTLAGLSQASQILVRESEAKKLNRHVFNEAYLMHTSTSPFYPLIASCDVAAAMMDGPAGHALVEEAIQEALAFRREMRGLARGRARTGDWWFDVWGPAADSAEREAWQLRPNEAWHGFSGITEGFTMHDPTKVTVLTPGLQVDGGFEDRGIPAALVAKYLAENGVIVEKYGLYSMFVMFTIGVARARWQQLLQRLERFKADYDANQPVDAVMPKFAAAHPAYRGLGLRELAQRIHDAYRSSDIGRMTTETYVSEIVPAMKPSQAFAKTAHEEIERVPLDEIVGRVSAVLLTPYPPGIPLLVPGERFNAAIVKYLKFARAFSSRYPGFETDIHGLAVETVNGVRNYFVDCVKE
ncbi:MAG TPA: aminotransferase class I/II-fold pyridoxal phosphate-dependent enzyme [Bdellovibrionales bacterium]|nr:aminotransferase class I/II-fold pyridoxal phosphate-dependent enzyme [Bdellovibrionales bacterium]